MSIKDGCSSYVFPIHQRPRDTRPHTDGQLNMMEGEKVGIRQGEGEKVKIPRMKEQENEREKKGHKQLKYIRSQRMATEDRFQVQTKWSKMSSVQRAEAAFCLGIYFVQGGLLPPLQHSLKRYRIL